ncbi:MAG: NAD(P)H-hydrate dehydratase [Paracoccus sp. (in: a-proteobacteria)]|nr:NAD(P)H-hydrate dehydratase [Paracoccus sp. (in: a-proteobacteria)]
MTRILTPEQMREVERAAMSRGALTALQLMENAGQAVVDAMAAKWPHYEAQMDQRAPSALVLCGPGKNGGDGFVIARLLAGRGWRVEVLLWGDADKLPPEARLNYTRWAEMGAVGPLDPAGHHLDCDVMIDALFGTGLTRPLDRRFEGLLSDIYDARGGPDPGLCHIVAVDIPSWLSAETGRVMLHRDELAPQVDLTVTFHAAKTGHYLADGPDFCGDLVVAPIGLAADGPEFSDPVELVQLSRARLHKDQGHKYSHGHALILTGHAGHGGAARLAARAALRVGAGAVTMGCPHVALRELAAPPDALMRRVIESAADLADALNDQRINALCLGPGMGVERAADLLPVALQSRRAVVLDADALSALAADGALFSMIHDRCVLTPHEGEFGRLFPDLADRLNPAFHPDGASKLALVQEASARCGATVLLKGPDTVIAAPGQPSRINSAPDVPWLATAGAGDVLSGIITGLLARRNRPADAAGWGAALHAASARAFGPGLIADDLPELIPTVLREIGA